MFYCTGVNALIINKIKARIIIEPKTLAEKLVLVEASSLIYIARNSAIPMGHTTRATCTKSLSVVGISQLETITKTKLDSRKIANLQGEYFFD
jgi:hypothetical protein